jgi:hypothetical protein
MKTIQYQDEKTGKKEKAIEIVSLLSTLEEFETFNGSIETKIYESWYRLKQELTAILLRQPDGKEIIEEGDDEDEDGKEEETSIKESTANKGSTSASTESRRRKPTILG